MISKMVPVRDTEGGGGAAEEMARLEGGRGNEGEDMGPRKIRERKS